MPDQKTRSGRQDLKQNKRVVSGSKNINKDITSLLGMADLK